MDLLGSTLTLAGCIAVMGVVLSILNYNLNKKKSDKSDNVSDMEAEARMVSIEKDVQYIRMSVDGICAKLQEHEKQIQKLNKAVTVLSQRKGKDIK